ncbi:DUF262 domain-containing protein [Chromobacterium vaccinii]|uniref:DUF262 domain-containing protein n=1 Tax=Chromobacterium vaccinii TaxID=1108595 RepID=UPI0009F6A99A|nr:DUF262 domain-containing protein [Chromobacterium vaccinii]
MLSDEIANAQRLVRTDAYQMSIGEIVSMYENEEIIIAPDFQRLFRWSIGQKSKLIESLLLGIPLPSIFVFEKEDGKWELIDGLQRVSTILEFMGLLKSPDGQVEQPSILEATKYLPSLHNSVWQQSDRIQDASVDEQRPLDKSYQLAIRRARIGVEILKRPSDNQTKFDLFQRLNSGGTQANAQELRNCIMLMVNGDFFRMIKGVAESDPFKTVVDVTEDQIEKQRHMELAVRFLVHLSIPYDGVLDVEEYIDEGVISLATSGNYHQKISILERVFNLLSIVGGRDALRRYAAERYVGKVGLIGLETIAVGVAKNIDAILALPNPESFVRGKIIDFWQQQEVERFTSPGLRGTTRIQRTVPFGERWFQP